MKNYHDYIPGVSCPACFATHHAKHLRAGEGTNAVSRFCEANICSACGVEEAFRGFFWRHKALQRGFALKPGGYHDNTAASG